MTRLRTRLGITVLCLAAACALGLPALSADTASASFPTLALLDGRVLHNARIISNKPDSVVIRADEGLMMISKTKLPESVAVLYPVQAPTPTPPGTMMKPFNPNPADASGMPAPKPRPTPRPTPKAAENHLFRGCSIVSFQAKAFQTSLGCAEVVIRNETDSPVEIQPGNIVCITTTGVGHAGRFFIIDGTPPIVKRSEITFRRGEISTTSSHLQTKPSTSPTSSGAEVLVDFRGAGPSNWPFQLRLTPIPGAPGGTNP